MSIVKQVKIIQLFHNLFTSGFNLPETVDFLERSQLVGHHQISVMKTTLLSGQGLSILMKNLGFSDTVVTQMALADIHGNQLRSLEKINAYLKQVRLVKKKLIEVMTYPILLLTFLVFIMLGLKNYLLPQIEEQNAATQLLDHFPIIFLISILFILGLMLLAYGVSKKVSPFFLVSQVSRLPFIGEMVKLYVTAYYAREWGNLLGQGIEMTAVVSLMQKQASRLFREVGQDMEKAFVNGQSFHETVLTYPFFLRELSLIIEYGHVKGHIGQELDIFSEELWERFFSCLHRATQLIQPFIFMLVAVMIVMIYAAMLLPMYQTMEVM